VNRDPAVNLTSAVVTAQGDESAGVAYRADGAGPEQCGIDQSIGSAGDERPDVRGERRSPWGHHVRAEGPHERLVGRRGVGDHGQTLGRGQLHHVAAHCPGGAADGERLAGSERQHIEGEARGEAVHGERRRFGIRCAGR